MRRRGSLAGIAAVGALALAGCGGGSSSNSGFPNDPLTALSQCLSDAKVKNKVDDTPNPTLKEIGKVSVPIPSDIIFIDVFKTPKDAAYYAKGGGGYSQYGHAVVSFNSYSKKKPQVSTVQDCIDATGVGSTS